MCIRDRDRNIANQALAGTGRIIGGEDARLWKGALRGDRVILEVEERAILNLSGRIGASVDGLLEKSSRPGLHEIAVVPITGGIAIAKNELTIVICELGSRPDGFEEQGRKTRVKARRTAASHDQIGESLGNG